MGTKVMYEYKARLVRVVDGDTVILMIDLGLNIYTNITVRIYGINTPEIVGPESIKAKQAKNRVIELLTNYDLRIKTYKDKKDKYGRYLADISTSNSPEGISVILLREGLALPASY